MPSTGPCCASTSPARRPPRQLMTRSRSRPAYAGPAAGGLPAPARVNRAVTDPVACMEAIRNGLHVPLESLEPAAHGDRPPEVPDVELHPGGPRIQHPAARQGPVPHQRLHVGSD